MILVNTVAYLTKFLVIIYRLFCVRKCLSIDERNILVTDYECSNFAIPYFSFHCGFSFAEFKCFWWNPLNMKSR